MPSSYKLKQAKEITKQMPVLKELFLSVAAIKYAVCVNCGVKNHDATNRFSKCRCGGTFQTYRT